MHCEAAAIKVARHGVVAHRAALGDIPYGPADLEDAYGLTSVAADYGSDQTVAIVDAYDDPTAESDLAVYRSAYGLPPCTTANGCFKKVNQLGGTGSFPAYDSGWAGEISLDLDAVSATCPHCHILLVEATSDYFSDLAASVDRAAAMGATQISNSYGGPEWAGEIGGEAHYDHAGVAVTVSSGDGGYGVEYPAASRYVTAVGGTSLVKDSSTRGWSETAWDGAGSGCSSYISKPAWQTDASCVNRSVADVSAVADPYTGIAVYDEGGWYQVGGTSLSSPVVAAAYALTGSAAAGGGFAYANPTWFNDVTSGSNAASCTFTYLCTAGSGFDGPTGVGTPASAHPSGPPPTGDGGSGSGGSVGGGRGGGTVTIPSAPPTVSSAVGLSSVSVAHAAIRAARNGVVRVKLTCGGGPACRGTRKLQTRLRGAALLSLGSARYSIASGRSAWMKLKLSRSRLALLKKRHSVRVYGTAVDSDGTSGQSSFMLHAPKHRR